MPPTAISTAAQVLFLVLFPPLILGVITSLFSTYVSAGQAELLMFLAMLAVLAVRPSGLMAGRK